MIKHKDQRVGVFIDVQNLYYSAKHIYHKKVNFREILNEAVHGRKLVRAIAYVVRTKGGEEKPFFEALNKAGIETRERDLKIFYGGAKKADWDVGLAMDIVRMLPQFDVIVLVSGDGDYVPVVEFARNHGKLIESISFGKTSAKELLEEVDDFTDLDKRPGKFLE